MSKIIVSFELRNNVDNAPRDKIEEWLKYELGQIGYMSSDNRLSEKDIVARNVKYEVE